MYSYDLKIDHTESSYRLHLSVNLKPLSSVYYEEPGSSALCKCPFCLLQTLDV
jgi:hypothetical protein